MWPAPIHATATLTTDVPREFVWRAFESAPRWPEVLKDIEAAEIEPDGRVVAGAVMRSRAVPGTMAVNMAYHVLEAEPPQRLVTESTAAGFRARTHYRFDVAANGGTDIALTAEVAAQKMSMRVFIAAKRSAHVQMVEGSLHRRMQSMLALAEILWREAGGSSPADVAR
jgi:hypothetical protein